MAVVTWRCPVPGCPEKRARAGTCPKHLTQFLLDQPDPAPAAVPTLALDCPWGQMVEIVVDGLEVGRESAPFHGGGVASYDQVSRRHARLFWREGQLHVDDLDSCNGTYVDGVEVTPGEPVTVRPGQELRLGLDVACHVVELNEFGEPR